MIRVNHTANVRHVQHWTGIDCQSQTADFYSERAGWHWVTT